jgi:hypothetical protein
LRLWPPAAVSSRGSLRLSLEDFTGDMGCFFVRCLANGGLTSVNGIKVTGRMRPQLDCRRGSGI